MERSGTSYKKVQLVRRIERGTIAGILLSLACHSFSNARRGKPRSGWLVALRHDSCPEGFSWLAGSEREAVSQANDFAKACADVVLEAIKQEIPVALCHAASSYMWSMDIFRRLYDLRPTVSHLDWFGFGSRLRCQTTIWSWNREMPAVLQKCRVRPVESARAAGNLSYPWRLRDSIASWFLGTWEQNALGYRWNSCRHSIPEYGNSGSIIQWQ